MTTMTIETSEAINFSSSVAATVDQYFANLKGDEPVDFYNLVLEEIEVPLLRETMRFTKNNQSEAARILGIARGTLRTKLQRYFDDTYISTRD